MNHFLHPQFIPAIVVLSLSLLSCSTLENRQKNYARTESLLEKRNFQEASRLVMEAKENSYEKKDQVLYYLDLGMLYHWAGLYEESNAMLSLAENRIEELFTESVSQNILSGVLNDNSLDYAGEDYEDIYLNVFKALNYIALNQYEAALVEIRKVNIKLNLLEDKYRQLIDTHNKSAEIKLDYPEGLFFNNVLARYLGTLLYREEGSIDDARIDIKLMDEAWETQKQFYHFPKPPFPALKTTRKARVNVLCFSGLSPIKIPETYYFGTGYNTVFFSERNQNDNYSETLSSFHYLPIPGATPGSLLKIVLPQMKNRSTAVDRVVVKLNKKKETRAPMLEDIQQIAQTTFESQKSLIVAKTILRATLKYITGQVGKEIIRNSTEDNVLGETMSIVFEILSDIAVEVSEQADLRISHFFPAHAWATEFTVEPGTYQIEIQYWNGRHLVSSVDHGTMEFRENKLNFIESYMLK